MIAHTSHTSEKPARKLKELQTNSVLNDMVLKAEDNSKEPVVNLGLKGVWDEVFGFIKVGGDFN